jgi:hypothetical protein
MTTPEFLRGVAVNNIIGIMHTAHESGPWAIQSVDTIGEFVLITFIIGNLYPDVNDVIVDNRPRVQITVRELKK